VQALKLQLWFQSGVECVLLSQTTIQTPEDQSDADYSTAVRKPSEGTPPLSLAARIEALLFVSASLVTVGQLASALNTTSRNIEKALESLEEDCAERGIRLQRHRSGVQLTTAPETATEVELFLQLESTARLTRAALEVMSIVAYQQPVTRPQIDAVRGVNSDSVLRTLLRHGLIEEVGRSQGPGRPFLYSTTSEFLQQFGITSLQDLPPLTPSTVEELEGEVPGASESPNGELVE
jgi:segregation and condensation protein B